MRTTRLRLALAALAALLVAFAAACGSSGGGSGSGQTTTISLQQFRSQVRKACQNATFDLNAVAQQLQGSTSAQQAASVIQKLGTRVSALRSRLAELQPPAGQKAGYQRYLAGLGALTADAQRLGNDIRRRDIAAARQDAVKLESQGRSVDRIAKQVPALGACAGS